MMDVIVLYFAISFIIFVQTLVLDNIFSKRLKEALAEYMTNNGAENTNNPRKEGSMAP